MDRDARLPPAPARPGRGHRPALPTPGEIAEACRRIRLRWSEADARERAGLPAEPRWMPPIVEAPPGVDEGDLSE